jgi:hypothetical protein
MSTRSRSLVLPLILAACAPKQGQLFRGHWIIGTEESELAFQPCGSTDQWLVVFDSLFLASTKVETALVYVQPEPGSNTSPSAQPPPLPPPMFITLRGDTTATGSYGPKDAYHRRLVVHQMGDTTGHCP